MKTSLNFRAAIGRLLALLNAFLSLFPAVIFPVCLITLFDGILNMPVANYIKIIVFADFGVNAFVALLLEFRFADARKSVNVASVVDCLIIAIILIITVPALLISMQSFQGCLAFELSDCTISFSALAVFYVALLLVASVFQIINLIRFIVGRVKHVTTAPV